MPQFVLYFYLAACCRRLTCCCSAFSHQGRPRISPLSGNVREALLRRVQPPSCWLSLQIKSRRHLLHRLVLPSLSNLFCNNQAKQTRLKLSLGCILSTAAHTLFCFASFIAHEPRNYTCAPSLGHIRNGFIRRPRTVRPSDHPPPESLPRMESSRTQQ